MRLKSRAVAHDAVERTPRQIFLATRHTIGRIKPSNVAPRIPAPAPILAPSGRSAAPAPMPIQLSLARPSEAASPAFRPAPRLILASIVSPVRSFEPQFARRPSQTLLKSILRRVEIAPALSRPSLRNAIRRVIRVGFPRRGAFRFRLAASLRLPNTRLSRI